MVKTSFKITSAVRFMENEILKETGLSRTAFQRRALEEFFKGEQKINEEFKNWHGSSPDHISKSVKEQIYLDDEWNIKVEECAKREQCRKTTVLFQVLYDFCLECEGLLSEEAIQKLVDGTYEV